LRLDKTEDGGKYRWPTSAGKKRPNGPTAHLPNGELPLTCCRPLEGKPQIQTIGLIEGIGPKPFITAQVRSQILIGAAGGNFAASQQTLKAYLDTLSTELGTKQLILYPDAGAISNSHVMRQYRRLKELVTRWGLSLRVAWWNQIDKSADLDADELLAAGRGEEIEEITWAEFEEFTSKSSIFSRRRRHSSSARGGKRYKTPLRLTDTSHINPILPLLHQVL
jgi:hypothetical protein